MREPGTKVVNETEHVVPVGDDKVQIRVTEWNDTDLISVDVYAERDGEWFCLNGLESLDDVPDDTELQDMLAAFRANPDSYRQ